MIDIINKEIEEFLLSVDNDKKNIQTILEKSTTSITDDLNKGHLTTNVCMVAGLSLIHI